MAITIETGAIVPGAESLCSVAFADAFHAGRGNTLWATLSENEKEQALRRFTLHASGRYRSRWQGDRVSSAQPMDWPRAGVVADGYLLSSSIIPEDVQSAWAMGAFKAAAEDLDADLERGVKAETVGPITTVYDEKSSRVKQYAAIDRLLQPYLKGGNGMMLVRA